MFYWKSFFLILILNFFHFLLIIEAASTPQLNQWRGRSCVTCNIWPVLPVLSLLENRRQRESVERGSKMWIRVQPGVKAILIQPPFDILMQHHTATYVTNPKITQFFTGSLHPGSQQFLIPAVTAICLEASGWLLEFGIWLPVFWSEG